MAVEGFVSSSARLNSVLRETALVLAIAGILGALMLLGPILALAISVGILVSPAIVFAVALTTGLRRSYRGSAGAAVDRAQEKPLSGARTCVRVVRVSGDCVLGQRFRVGQRFFIEKGRVEPILCPFLCGRLQRWADAPPFGSSDALPALVCSDADHRVELAFEKGIEFAKAGERRERRSGV